MFTSNVDDKFSISGHHFYHNRLCNFSNAPVVGSLVSDDFDYLQNFIRNDLHEILVSKYDEKSLGFDNHYNSCFYGIYSSLRSKFSFTRGDLKILQLVVENVANKLREEECSDIEYHYSVKNKQIKKSVDSWQSNLVETPIGMFYGDKNDGETGKLQVLNAEDLETNLAARCKKIVDFFSNLKKIREFDKSCVSIHYNNGTYKGTVTCPFCEMLSRVVHVKVSYQMCGKSGSWVCSNLAKHINHHHVEGKDETGAEREVCSKKAKMCKVPSIKTSSINPPMHSESRSSLLKLEIEPVYRPTPTSKDIQFDAVHEDHKYAFLKQLSTQNIGMTNATILNFESVVEFYSEYDLVDESRSKQVRCCRIEGDGDCLFGSISHQLLGEKIYSADHRNSTLNLRRRTVSYIKDNIDRFMPYMKDRVYTQLEKRGINPREVTHINLKAECLNFLETKLIDKAWGGTELLKAISGMELVNILIINDDGSCNMVTDFVNSYPRSITICFDQNNKHYDSVVSVDEQTLFDFIKSVLRAQMMKNQDCCIVID